jgi:hypothetical protein
VKFTARLCAPFGHTQQPRHERPANLVSDVIVIANDGEIASSIFRNRGQIKKKNPSVTRSLV